jgi:hypothetical protein
MPRRRSRVLLAISTAAAVTASSAAELPAPGDRQAATIDEPRSVIDVEVQAERPVPEERGSLRLLHSSEITAAISGMARQILHEHRGRPLGHEVPFELDGRRYVARLERHYHAPGSGERPIGEHVGVTVYLLP